MAFGERKTEGGGEFEEGGSTQN